MTARNADADADGAIRPNRELYREVKKVYVLAVAKKLEAGIGSKESAVYDVLTRWAERSQGRVSMPIEDLAEVLALTTDSVKSCLKRLAKKSFDWKAGACQ